MARPICFMVMPFGIKPVEPRVDGAPDKIDFDALWNRALAPVITDLGYDPIRADQDTGAAIILEMLERLFFSDLVLADMTIPNGNVLGLEIQTDQALPEPVLHINSKITPCFVIPAPAGTHHQQNDVDYVITHHPRAEPAPAKAWDGAPILRTANRYRWIPAGAGMKKRARNYGAWELMGKALSAAPRHLRRRGRGLGCFFRLRVGRGVRRVSRRSSATASASTNSRNWGSP